MIRLKPINPRDRTTFLFCHMHATLFSVGQKRVTYIFLPLHSKQKVHASSKWYTKISSSNALCRR